MGEWLVIVGLAWGLWVTGWLFGWLTARRDVKVARRDARIAWRLVAELTQTGECAKEQKGKAKARRGNLFAGVAPEYRARLRGVWWTAVVLQ